jgi:hypothetical protein
MVTLTMQERRCVTAVPNPELVAVSEMSVVFPKRLALAFTSDTAVAFATVVWPSPEL